MNQEISQNIDFIEKTLWEYLLKIPNFDFDPVAKIDLKNILQYVLQGGKRLRSLMFLDVAQVLGVSAKLLVNYILAIEFVHAYSLIHDDLPDLDNDDLRRGWPTAHKVFGPDMAILIGDALQSLAFELLTSVEHFHPRITVKIANLFAKTIGPLGLVGGEAQDTRFGKSTQKPTLKDIETIHMLKTAKFFGFCASAPAILAEQSAENIQKFEQMGLNFGLIYQMIDDLEDFTPDRPELNLLNHLSRAQILQKIHYLQQSNESILISLDSKNSAPLYNFFVKNAVFEYANE